jgi:hypothetical protein
MKGANELLFSERVVLKNNDIYHKKNRRVEDVIPFPSVWSRFHESNANNMSIPYSVKVLKKGHLGLEQLGHIK